MFGFCLLTNCCVTFLYFRAIITISYLLKPKPHFSESFSKLLDIAFSKLFNFDYSHQFKCFCCFSPIPGIFETFRGKRKFWTSLDLTTVSPSTELIPGRDFICTDIVISVDKYLKNPLSSKKVIVRTVGGAVGKVSMKSDVEPSFKLGEKVLLCLSKDTTPYTVGPEHFMVFGSSQGKFTLTDDGKATTPTEKTTLDKLLSILKTK
jgi:hypothetical protein